MFCFLFYSSNSVILSYTRNPHVRSNLSPVKAYCSYVKLSTEDEDEDEDDVLIFNHDTTEQLCLTSHLHSLLRFDFM